MNFKIGQLISAYDMEGLPCKGRISSFAGTLERGPLARIRLERKDHDGKDIYVEVRLDTAHLLPIQFAKHSKETFLAAASRCGPCLYFKDDKARRDYLEALWEELANFSKDD